jgi:8-oxo-dGTP pyrophosphatase MutT (NUDIX family)
VEKKLLEILTGRLKIHIHDANLMPAAVLIPLFVREGEYNLLFTRRTETVEHHKGQISFPGGRRDPEDPDLLATALREAEEEMGIRRKDVRIVGELDDICTVTNFCVTPFVGLIPYPYPFQVNLHEIEEVLEIPLAVLLNKAHFREEIRERSGQSYPAFFYQYKHHAIWGATARILKQLLDLLPQGKEIGKPVDQGLEG